MHCAPSKKQRGNGHSNALVKLPHAASTQVSPFQLQPIRATEHASSSVKPPHGLGPATASWQTSFSNRHLGCGQAASDEKLLQSRGSQLLN